MPGLPHFAPRAKHVIYLFQNGAPTHVDLFDWKPKLKQMHGQPLPEEYIGGRRFSTMTGNPQGKLMLAPVEPFAQHGQSGAWVSNFLPHTAKIVDQLCFVKSMHTDAVNHAPAISFLLSGGQIPGRPTLGAWLAYGLGSESDNLPAFVVMTSVSKGTSCGQIFYDFYWGSGFLPSRFQGVKLRGSGDPVLYLSNPDGMSRQMRRELAGRHRQDQPAQAATSSAIRKSPPGLPNTKWPSRCRPACPSWPTCRTRRSRRSIMYGPQVKEPGTFAHNCLLARRLVERGVRCVQLMHAGWDQHNSLTTELYTQCKDTDQPSAALVQDLSQSRLAGRHAGHLGWRIRPHAVHPGRHQQSPALGPRPSPLRLHHLAGRRRREAGPHLTARPTSWVSTRSRDPVHVHDFQATLCTCWASITSG